MPAVKRYAPVLSLSAQAPDSASLLILGSMPGLASLRAAQYYAHPRNQFWPIMTALFALPPAATYDQRIDLLNRHGIALWDVLRACERPGSLDSSIVRASEVPNDIIGFIGRHPGLRAIALNGGAAAAAFRRHLGKALVAVAGNIVLLPLPSTSPANAGTSAAEKLAVWRAVTAYASPVANRPAVVALR